MRDLARESGWAYRLTTDLPAGDEQLVHGELANVAQYVDWINMMCYDFQEPSGSFLLTVPVGKILDRYRCSVREFRMKQGS
jgi:hypothetical protein